MAADDNGGGMEIGLVYRAQQAPPILPAYAQQTEAAGFDALWLWEDCFYHAGIATAATALAVTERLAVGLGVMPAVVRNPVFTAMEIASLAHLYPGRFRPGLGHGVGGWMRQIGAMPQSQLAALEEVTLAVRALLRGERFSFDGTEISLDDVALVYPPAAPPPVVLGVRGPTSLTLSGRVADGTILAEYAAPDYIRWARQQIASGQAEAGRGEAHQLTVYALACAAETTAQGREMARPLLAAALTSGAIDSQIGPLGILPQVAALRDGRDAAALAPDIPDAWIDALTLCGTPEDWARGLDALAAAGAHTVALVPPPQAGLEIVAAYADQLRPWRDHTA